MIVSIGASVVVIGGLLTGSISLQKALLENERRVGHYADQRRLIDYVARDLRRALEVSIEDAGGTRLVDEEVFMLDENTTLRLTIPGYYQSDDPANRGFDDPLQVRHYPAGADYGTPASPSSPVPVSYRKVRRGEELVFLREESGRTELVAKGAEGLTLRLFFSAKGRVCDLEAIYRTNERGYRQVRSSFEQAMLRNPPLESFR
jgi:hypothetical protein